MRGRGVRQLKWALGIVGALAAAGLVAGCSGDAPASESSEGLPRVVVAAYPLEYLALTVGGDQVVVENVAASGGDAHHLELSPAQAASVGDADLALYLSGGFQSAMEEAIAVTKTESYDALEAVDPADMIPGDPHVWLDPLISADIADHLAVQLGEANPEKAPYYEANAAELRGQLEELDARYAEALGGCKGETLLTSHEAFGYLAARYGLEQSGVLGLDPEAEPSPARINEVLSFIEERGITTLFVEPGGAGHHEGDRETKLTQTLGVAGVNLDPLEIQNDADRDFLQVMEDNLAALREGLACAS